MPCETKKIKPYTPIDLEKNPSPIDLEKNPYD
jgi:hypothetical protein